MSIENFTVAALILAGKVYKVTPDDEARARDFIIAALGGGEAVREAVATHSFTGWETLQAAQNLISAGSDNKN